LSKLGRDFWFPAELSAASVNLQGTLKNATTGASLFFPVYKLTHPLRLAQIQR